MALSEAVISKNLTVIIGLISVVVGGLSGVFSTLLFLNKELENPGVLVIIAHTLQLGDICNDFLIPLSTGKKHILCVQTSTIFNYEKVMHNRASQ